MFILAASAHSVSDVMREKSEQPHQEISGRETKPVYVSLPASPVQPADDLDHGQVVFDPVAELQRQLRDAQAELARHEAAQDRQRGQANIRQKRWRARNPELARTRDAEYKRKKRARERGQDQ